MKRLFFLLILIFAPTHYSQDKNEFKFEFDYAQFSFDTTANYVEFYYAFNQASLSREVIDSTTYTKGILHITIQDSTTGELVVDKDWLISQPLTDTAATNKSLIGVIGFILEEGSYKCVITGSDHENPDRNRALTEYFAVHPFLKMGTTMSDIQLASNIIQGSENTSSIFYKNTFEVLPIPTTTFGENQPVLFYYTELYNLKGTQSDNNLRIDQYVLNSRAQVVFQKSKMISRSLNSRVEVGTIMIYKLPSDTYTLVLSLIDSVANYGVSSSKKFFVYNPSVEYVDTFKVKGSNFVTGMFGVMSDEELDDFFKKSRYVSTIAEIDKYESLSEEGAKRKFLTDFWEARDTDANDGKNQDLANFLKRLDVANQRYKAMGKEGWKTDRGRVYIIYGEPSEIDRYPNQTDAKPYEIWHYQDIEGGVIFVFADMTGFSDYMLVHSNKRGELRDDNWQRRVAP